MYASQMEERLNLDGGIWRRLTEPAAEVRDASERRFARAVAGVLVLLLPLNLVFSLVIWALVDDFGGIFWLLRGLDLVMVAAWRLSRGRRYTHGAAMAAMGMIGVGAAIGWVAPGAAAWSGFMLLALLMVGVGLRPGLVAAVGVIDCVAVAAVVSGSGMVGLEGASHLALHAIGVPLMVLLARQWRGTLDLKSDEAVPARRTATILRALDQAATAVAEVDGDDAIFAAVKDTLEGLGYRLSILMLDDEGALRLRYSGVSGENISRLQSLVGITRQQFKLAPDGTPFHARVMAGETVFADDATEVLAATLPQISRSIVSSVGKILNFSHMIGSPIDLGEGPIGLFIVLSGELRQSDVIHVALFARQLSAALRKAADRTALSGAKALLEQRTGTLELRNEEMERFTYTVSHDLRSPLITIRGFLGALEEDLERGDAEAVREDLQFIEGAAAKMERLLEELLDLSRVGRVAQPDEVLPVSGLVKEALDLLGPEAAMRVVIEEGLPEFRGDRARLVQVFQNLLDNALKFSPEGSPVRVFARRDGDAAVVCVEDQGPGIPPEYRERVFDLFERLDPARGGTGVGLAIVKRVIELHGGSIWIEGDGHRKGCRVCLTNPGRSQPL
jgi:signal transduction histidine kinase